MAQATYEHVREEYETAQGNLHKLFTLLQAHVQCAKGMALVLLLILTL